MFSRSVDFLAVGECLRDVFYRIDEATVSCSLNKDRCLLCLAYADKIPIHQIDKVAAAGNSANAAVAASRLGFKSALVSWIGNDTEGRHLKDALKRDRVDVSQVREDAKSRTNEATILNFKGERTQLVYFNPRTFYLKPWPKAKCLYYSAMGKGYGTVDRAVFKYLKNHPDTVFVFQPGTTHIRHGLPKMRRLIAVSHALILNKDEAHYLLPDGERTTRNMLAVLHAMGAGLVVITDGPNGADAFNGETYWHMPIFPGKPVESTGAGDAFASTMACALMRGHDVETALRWGTANSWGVIRQIGPQAGLLDAKGLEAALKKFKNIKARAVR